jgi:hypothetical protein
MSRLGSVDLGSVDLGTVDPSAAQRSLSACRQDPCQDEKIFCLPANHKPCQVCQLSPHGKTRAKLKRSFAWGQLTPPSLPVRSQSVRGQENIMLTCAVTMREHTRKTLIQSPELRLPLMEIDSRTIIYNDYNRLGTIYSSAYANYRRSLSNGRRYTNHNITICYCCCTLL